jgi:hypothetical protein
MGRHQCTDIQTQRFGDRFGCATGVALDEQVTAIRHPHG